MKSDERLPHAEETSRFLVYLLDRAVSEMMFNPISNPSNKKVQIDNVDSHNDSTGLGTEIATTEQLFFARQISSTTIMLQKAEIIETTHDVCLGSNQKVKIRILWNSSNPINKSHNMLLKAIYEQIGMRFPFVLCFSGFAKSELLCKIIDSSVPLSSFTSDKGQIIVSHLYLPDERSTVVRLHPPIVNFDAQNTFTFFYVSGSFKVCLSFLPNTEDTVVQERFK